MFSARNARVRLGVGQGLFVGTRWTVNDKNQATDITSFEDGGYSMRQSSVWDVRFTVEGFWNEALNPHTPPSSIFSGSIIQSLRLYLDRVNDATLFWHFNYAYIEENDTEAAPRDGMKFKFTGYNQGPFLRPGELVARTPPATS